MCTKFSKCFCRSHPDCPVTITKATNKRIHRTLVSYLTKCPCRSQAYDTVLVVKGGNEIVDCRQPNPCQGKCRPPSHVFILMG